MPIHEQDSQFAQEHPGLADALAGQFQIQREIGRGGMGVVYLAREVRLDRLVALKVLPTLMASQPASRERFLREARTAARLAHPNVVPVYRADEAGGTAFFAMAFVEGESLGERVGARGPLPPGDAVPILRAVAWALAYAHAHGVVHRDVKPENILLERATGRTLVTDFGIAHSTAPSDASARLTQDGHLLGSLHYMSPEQVNGEPLDGRSDLYSLGVVAYYVLSGRVPFAGLATTAVLLAHATRAPAPLATVAPHVPASLADVVDRCLAKHRDARYPTGEALAAALDAAMAAVGPIGVAETGFPPGLPERVDETQAAEIWRRAAQLQADALHRLDVRENLRDGVRSFASGSPVSDSPVGRDVDALASGYRLVDVASAAADVGISRQYVAMALAELPRGALPTTAALGVSEREATTFLGTDLRSVGVTVEVPASAARTLRALGTVLQQTPYELQLRETVGPHPLDGGIIVFDLPGVIVGASGATASAVNMYWMGTHQQLEARQVQVTLRATSSERTAVTMTADLRPGVRRNVRAAQWTAGLAGSLGGTAVAAVLIKQAIFVSAAVASLPAVGVASLVAAASVWGYRKLYPSVLTKAEGEMRRALQSVTGAVQSEVVFGSLPGPGRLQRGSSNAGDDAMLSML